MFMACSWLGQLRHCTLRSRHARSYCWHRALLCPFGIVSSNTIWYFCVYLSVHRQGSMLAVVRMTSLDQGRGKVLVLYYTAEGSGRSPKDVCGHCWTCRSSCECSAISLSHLLFLAHEDSPNHSIVVHFSLHEFFPNSPSIRIYYTAAHLCCLIHRYRLEARNDKPHSIHRQW